MACLPVLRFGREITGVLDDAERREWWLADGHGGYAAGTIAGSLTRCYHGLLIANAKPPLGRALLWAKLDATLCIGAGRWPLFVNRWPGDTLDPTGHTLIEAFELEGRLPVWHYQAGGLRLTMRIWMPHGSNGTAVAFRAEPDDDEAHIEARVLVNARDHHARMLAGGFDPAVSGDGHEIRVETAGFPALRLHAEGGAFTPRRDWIEHFQLKEEAARGLADTDNHLCIADARLDLRAGAWSGIVARTDRGVPLPLARSLVHAQARETARIRITKRRAPVFRNAPAWIERLLLAADSFLVRIAERPAVIAGYPWFGEWGRDTMIALPGLALATGRHECAAAILVAYAEQISGGLLPNNFQSDGAEPVYNTVDAALWFIEAWRAYVASTHDTALLATYFDALADVIARYRAGTHGTIVEDPADGLIRAGEPGLQLTWMDAKVDDWVVTPRIGKPVEIQALWYNALCSMSSLAKSLGRDPSQYQEAAERVRRSFARFVPSGSESLLDVVDGPEGDDASIRPNQIFAASLPYSPLDRETMARIVRIVGKRLLCSYGLLSLDPADPKFRPTYTGDRHSRDGAYHQGTAWAWLLPHYALAHHRVHGDTSAARRFLEPLADHLADAGLGTISEIFDAVPPHTPRGCPAQAWSVATVLQAWAQLTE